MSRFLLPICLVAVAMSVMLAAPLASASPTSELDSVLQETLKHPGVSASGQQVQAARQDLAASHRRYWGSGGVQAEVSRFDDPRFVGMFTPDALASPPFSDDLTRYGLFYEVPIDLGGVIAASRQAAQEGLQAARLEQRQTRLLKLHDSLSAYVRLQALQTQQAAIAVQRQRVEQTVRRVTEQVQTEQAAAAELSLAKAEAARLRADEIRLQGLLEQTRAALQAASGQDLLPASRDIVSPAWSAQATEKWLPVDMAESRLAGATAQAEAVRRSLWPQLAVGGDYSRFDGQDYDQNSWRISASVTLPLDAAAHRRSQAASARAEAARYQRQDAEREARRQWAALHSAYRSASADADAAQEEVTAREEVVQQQAELARVGLSSLEELLRQQRDLLDAVARRASAQARVAESWSAAQVLLGIEARAYIDQLAQGHTAADD